MSIPKSRVFLRLRPKFVEEMTQFLELPPTPPQLRVLSLKQRLQKERYSGDENDEDGIRAFLIRKYGGILSILEYLCGDYEVKTYDSLDMIKTEIMRVKSQIKQLRGVKMCGIFDETINYVRRVGGGAKQMMEDRAKILFDTALLGKSPIKMISNMIDEEVKEESGESLIEKIDQKLEQKGKDFTIDDVTNELEKMFIIDERFVEIGKQSTARFNEKKKDAMESLIEGLEKMQIIAETQTEFAVFYFSFKKSFLIFYFP